MPDVERRRQAWLPLVIRWDRVGRWALLCVFALVVYLYVGPARTWVVHLRARPSASAPTSPSCAARTSELRDAQARGSKRDGRARAEARKLGMVKAGEKLYVVE